MKARMPGGPRKTITSLNVMVKAVERGMWPTPSARDWKDVGQGRYGRGQLPEAVRESFKTPTSAPFSHGGSGGELHKQVAPSGGPLNPTWVEWLMGFPTGWTDLPHWETRSSRRSRNGSADASSKPKEEGERDG